MSFNPGDIIVYTNPHTNKRYEGVVLETIGIFVRVTLYAEHNAISDDGAYLVDASFLQLKVQTPFKAPPVHTIPKFVSALEENSKFKPLYSNTDACTHEFKTYTGLTKKYEYCTKCDTKKNERGAYEN